MIAGFPQSVPARTEDELRTLNQVDARVRTLATSFGAQEVQYSSLIARAVLDCAEYPEAFPHLLMSTCGSSLGSGDAGEWCLSPAVCYHAYAQLAARVVEWPIVITARGRCFRAETDTAPGVRQIEFEMREIVLLGQPAWVDTTAEAARLAIGTIAGDMRLAGQWLPAEDPFFLPAMAGKALMQRLLKVKVEYQWPGPGGLALASVNRHASFFGERFGITMPDGQPVHTACIAVGLDRWAHHAHRPAADVREEVAR